MQQILAGSDEVAEVGHENFLIRGRRRVVADIQARREFALVNGRAAARIDDGEARRGRNGHFSQVAEKVADHRLLRQRRHIAFLVHVDRRTVTLHFAEGAEQRAARPE